MARSGLFFGLDLSRVEHESLPNSDLSSGERKMKALMAVPELRRAIFQPDEPILQRGEIPLEGVLITRGEAAAVVSGLLHRFGPGSVLGLAEGLVHQPLRHLFQANTVVEALCLSVVELEVAIERSPPQLRGIFSLVIERVLHGAPSARAPLKGSALSGRGGH
jgi:CRP-like cAMP-binding protein